MPRSDDLVGLLEESIRRVAAGSTGSPLPPAEMADARTPSGEGTRRASARELREIAYLQERYDIDLEHYKCRFRYAQRARSRRRRLLRRTL
jgi:hypothetical protein